MPLHLVKLCVGIDSLEELRERRRTSWTGRITTRQTPKRAAEICDGGSLYWVIRGEVRARQRVLGIGAGHDEDGRARCEIRLDAAIVAVEPVSWRPFQGWRYLAAEAAPPDLGSLAAPSLPAELRRELRALGLL